jgi:hypothetical protein
VPVVAPGAVLPPQFVVLLQAFVPPVLAHVSLAARARGLNPNTAHAANATAEPLNTTSAANRIGRGNPLHGPYLNAGRVISVDWVVFVFMSREAGGWIGRDTTELANLGSKMVSSCSHNSRAAPFPGLLKFRWGASSLALANQPENIFSQTGFSRRNWGFLRLYSCTFPFLMHPCKNLCKKVLAPHARLFFRQDFRVLSCHRLSGPKHPHFHWLSPSFQQSNFLDFRILDAPASKRDLRPELPFFLRCVIRPLLPHTCPYEHHPRRPTKAKKLLFAQIQR